MLRFNENSGYTMAQQCYDTRILPALFISNVSNVEFKIARPHTKKDNVDRMYALEAEYVAPNGRTDAAILKW